MLSAFQTGNTKHFPIPFISTVFYYPYLFNYFSFERSMILLKSKVDYPYINLHVEPNIVLVFQMEKQQYITVSDLIGGNKLQVFEIENDHFQTFNFRERQSVEGKGFFIQQEELVKLAEEINKHIQKIHMRNQLRPVHIVTSESAAGSLRVSLPRPKTVIGFPDSFSVGPLWKLDEKDGQNNRKEWLFEHINYELEEYEYENKFANTIREIEDIPKNVPIFVWYGDNPDEQTALRFFLYLLRDRTNEIFIINSTVETETLFHTGQLDTNKLTQIFEVNKENKPLSIDERNLLSKEWKKLSQTKESLRIWSEEEIKGVPDCYYDQLIIETIQKLHHEQGTKDYIKAADVVVEVFTQMNSYIDFYFIEYRIRHLIYSGSLELKGIPKSIRHYKIKLK